MRITPAQVLQKLAEPTGDYDDGDIPGWLSLKAIPDEATAEASWLPEGDEGPAPDQRQRFVVTVTEVSTDPADTCQPGDPDPTAAVPRSRWCGDPDPASPDPWAPQQVCTREREPDMQHASQHVAGDSRAVLAVWPTRRPGHDPQLSTDPADLERLPEVGGE